MFPSQPLADPLADYLLSLKKLAKLPGDTLVLPSHGLPFHGLHVRLDQLARHHADRLDALQAYMSDGEQTGTELAHRLFAKAMAEGPNVLALAETLAHAHRLVGEKRARRVVGKDGVVRFKVR